MKLVFLYTIVSRCTVNIKINKQKEKVICYLNTQIRIIIIIHIYWNITEQRKQTQNKGKNSNQINYKYTTKLQPQITRYVTNRATAKKTKSVKTCDLHNDKVYSQEILHQNRPFFCPFLMTLAASSGKKKFRGVAGQHKKR